MFFETNGASELKKADHIGRLNGSRRLAEVLTQPIDRVSVAQLSEAICVPSTVAGPCGAQAGGIVDQQHSTRNP